MTTENTNDSNMLQISAVNNNEPILIGSRDDDELIGDSGKNFIADNDLFDSTVEDNDRLDGGEGNDFIFASGGDDTLIGGAGDDSLFGGRGNDVAVFIGHESEYEISTNAFGLTTVTNISDLGQGTDLVIGIETIQFDDGDIEPEEPVDENPVDENPVDETPEEPVDENPVDENPVDETPEEPVDENPVDETPEEPVDETPVDETPEEPVDETPPDETPEEPVGETPVDEGDDSIEVTVSSPSSIVAEGTDIVTVTYTNTGDSDAIAPLLSLEAEGALLRPNDEAEFSETQIQFLGIINEGQAGVLAPGETNSFTVEFVTDGTTEEGINFSVSSIDSDEVIDWESLRESSRPDFIEPEAWNDIYDNFVAEVGTTAGDYQQLLVGNANYLSDLGDYEADVDDLLAFEFQQASDYQAISQRNSLGSFGRGRTFIGDIELSVDDEGNVAIDNTGTRRTFDLLADGTYQGQTGDFATLGLDEGVYTLTEPDGTATVFNTDGQIDFIADPNGNSLDAEYTEGQLTSLIDSFGNSLAFEYNGDSRIISVADSDGRFTNYEYDETGELLESVTDEVGTTTYTYDGVALASITDPNGTTIEFTYDDRGRLTQQSISSEDAATEVLNYSYGETGEVTVTDAQGNETELLLNENGQVGQLTDANGRLINFSYDNSGNLTQIIAPENNATLFGYDDRGNLTSQVDANGNITEFTYEDTFNQLTGFTDPNGNGIDYSYDESGNLTTITYEDGSSETFEYDENGDVTVSANRRGQEILYSYNDRGQIVSQINPDAEVPIEYTYDERGNLDTTTDENGTIDLDYDESDRLTKITYPNGRFLEYTYDEGDRRTSLTDQDGDRVNYAYDEAGRLASLTDDDDNLIVSYQYDEVGRLAREDKGNGTYTEYSYDLAGQLLSIENFAPDGTVNSSSVYAYDSLGRQTSLTTLDGEWTYGYDATGQLTSADFASTNSEISDQNLTYEYDAAGNRITTAENGESVDYTTNSLNQYTEVDGFDYEYDDDGNLVSQTNEEGTTLYVYNSENQLIGVTEPDGTVTSYEYDPFGNRVASIVDGERTEYLVDPFGFGDVVAEYDADGNLTASYTHGLGLESITNTEDSYYYDFNATGSTVGLTDADGGVVNSYFYSPFGNDIAETEAVVNPFEFVGQFGVAEEANGLDFMRARFYDSDTGRFISPDPIGLEGGDTNIYRYVNNNPIGITDPSGTYAFLYYLYPIVVNGVRIAATAIAKATPNIVRRIGSNATQFANSPAGQNVIASELLYVGLTPYDKLSPGGFFGNAVGGAFGGYSSAIGSSALNSAVSSTFLAESIKYSIDQRTLDFSPLIYDPNFYIAIGSSGAFSQVSFVQAYPGAGRFFPSASRRLATQLGDDIAKPVANNIFNQQASNTISSINNSEQQQEVLDQPDNQARSKGEPHLTTFDGVGYDFQGAGDFTLVESVDGDLNIQARYVQIDDNVTVASAVATEVDGFNVVIDSEGIEFVEDPNDPDNLIPRVFRSGGSNEATVTIDGEEVEIASGGSINVGNSRIFRSSGDEYTIIYAGENGVLEDGDDQLVVNYFRPGTINIVDVYLGDEQQGNITGLLGNLNGNPDDDIALRDGTVLPRPLEFDRLYGDYREEYRITSIEESLFTYEGEQNPDTYYNPNFPEVLLTYDTLSPDLRAKGDAAALEAGYEPGTFEFESVAFDFAITCDPAFLEGRETDPEAIGVDIVDDDENEPEPDGIIQGQNLIVDNIGTVGSVDLVTGELTDILDTNISLTDIDVDPDGNVFGVDFSRLYSIDLEAGTTTLVGSHGASGLNALEIGEDGTFYATSASSQDVFTIDPATGEATSIGTSPINIQSAGDLQFINDTLYLADTEELIALDVSGGTLNEATVIGSFNLEAESIFGITVDEDGDPVGLTDDGSILTIDLDTGEATAIGTVENNTTINGAAALPDGFFDAFNTSNDETPEIEEPISETPEVPVINDIVGLEIQLQAFSPNLETPISEAVTTTISDGIEFGALPLIELPGSTLVDVNIDITQEGEGAGSIFFEVDSNETFTSFASAEFNGYVFTDISDQIPAIENVTINESTNTLGLEADDVTFTENTIEVNVESLTFNPEDTLLLNIEFADV